MTHQLRREERLADGDVGWICRGAVAMRLFEGNGKHQSVHLGSGPRRGEEAGY